MESFRILISFSNLLVSLLVIFTLSCSIPAMSRLQLLIEYEIKFIRLIEDSCYLFAIIFSSGVTLPMFANSIILSVFEMRKLLSMVVLIFPLETVLLDNEFSIANMVVVDCILRIRAIVVLGIIANQIMKLQEGALMNIKLTLFAMFCGGCSLVFNTFASYQLVNSEVYFVFYLACSAISVLTLAILAFRLHQSPTNTSTTQSMVANRISLLYAVGTCLVSVVYIITSLVWRYQDSEDGTEWYVSLAMFMRTCTVVAVVLLEWQSLQREQLAQRVVEEAAAIEKTFVRLVSHELRSPLNAIDIGLNTILDEMTIRDYSDEAMEALDQVRSSCNFVTSILNDLLSAELLEKGIMQLTKTHLSAFSLVLDLITPSFLKAQALGVTLNLSPRRDLMTIELKDVTIHGDKKKLCQMMNNLLIYAINAVPRGSTVSVMATTLMKSARDRSSRKKAKTMQTFLKLSVFCPGKGVHVEEVERVFADERSGLGESGVDDDDSDLWVCKSIVTLHSGEISVAYDEHVGGCTFTVILPTMGTDSTSRRLRRRSSLSEFKKQPLVEERNDTELRDNDKDPSSAMGRSGSVNLRVEPLANVSPRRSPSSSSLRKKSNLGQPLDPPIGGSSEVSIRRDITSESPDQCADTACQSMVRRKMSDSLRSSNIVLPFDFPIDESQRIIRQKSCSSVRLSTALSPIDQQPGMTSQSMARRKMSDPLRRSNASLFQDPPIAESPDARASLGYLAESSSQSIVRRNISASLRGSNLVMPFDTQMDEFPVMSRQSSGGISSGRGSQGSGDSGYSSVASAFDQHFGRAVEDLRRRTRSGFVIPVNLPVEESKADGLQKITENVCEQGRPDKASLQCEGTQTQPVKVDTAMEPLCPSAALPMKSTMRYGSTVLVVDDSVINLKMMSRLAAKRCDTVIEAKDGVEAVAAVQASMKSGVPVDLVLMDFQMPNMDGPTAASAMRKMGYTGPIIGVTGNVLTVDKEFFISKGANKVLFKPVDTNQIDFALTGWQMTEMAKSQIR